MGITDKFDIRLIYLAIHHIIKYRGNFNYNMDNFNINNLDIKEKLIDVFDNFQEIANDVCLYQELPSKEEFLSFENICTEINKKDKQKWLEKYFYNYFHKKVSKEQIDSISEIGVSTIPEL